MGTQWERDKEKDESEIAGEKLMGWLLAGVLLAIYLYVAIGMELLGWSGLGG